MLSENGHLLQTGQRLWPCRSDISGVLNDSSLRFLLPQAGRPVGISILDLAHDSELSRGENGELRQAARHLKEILELKYCINNAMDCNGVVFR